jgi:CRP-like cAMP-binding protein
MTEQIESETITLGRRLRLLEPLACFQSLPEEWMRSLASALGVETFQPGATIVEESQIGSKLYLIERGEVIVSARGAHGPVILGHLGEGESFGEIALLTDEHLRRATVCAHTSVVLLSLGAEEFDKIVKTFPDVRMDLVDLVNTLMQKRLRALMRAKMEKVGTFASGKLSF